MQPSQSAVELVKSFEGLRLSAYPDPATGGKPWTIGYGHTDGVVKGQRITEVQAIALLAQDLARAAADVRRLVTAPLTQWQFDALVCFVFNVGAGRFSSSTMLRLLNARDYAGAAGEFGRWVYAGGEILPGLVRRRDAERKLFERPW